VSETVADAGLVPVRVVGWHGPAWADPAALEALGRGLRGRHRTTLLSPFDSLVWFGARTKRIFGFARRLEAYVPRAQRVHGYFAMPLLAGGRIVGRVDPAREGRTLVARQGSLARPAGPAMAAALTAGGARGGAGAVGPAGARGAARGRPPRRRRAARRQATRVRTRRRAWVVTACAGSPSATAASGVATRKLKLSSRYRRTVVSSCES